MSILRACSTKFFHEVVSSKLVKTILLNGKSVECILHFTSLWLLNRLTRWKTRSENYSYSVVTWNKMLCRQIIEPLLLVNVYLRAIRWKKNPKFLTYIICVYFIFASHHPFNGKRLPLTVFLCEIFVTLNRENYYWIPERPDYLLYFLPPIV
jgi:hypothetical protein